MLKSYIKKKALLYLVYACAAIVAQAQHLNVNNTVLSLNNKEVVNNIMSKTTVTANGLTWEHNNQDITLTKNLTKNFGANTTTPTPLSVKVMPRIWTVTNTNSLSEIQIKIPKTLIEYSNEERLEYVMVISDDYEFNTNVTSATMKNSGTELHTTLYFEGTKFITFGTTSISYETKRCLSFDGSNKYLTAGNVHNLANTDFTISAWFKRHTNSNNFDIISKRNAVLDNLGNESSNQYSYTKGYGLCLNETGKIVMEWKNANDDTNNRLESYTVIPENQWHHVAVSFNSDTNSTILYINGLQEVHSNILTPIQTVSNAEFIIGASHHLNRQRHCKGNIDEVRIWNVALSENQIRYIMNQEISNNSDFVDGKILPSSILKNEIRTISWDNLMGYYPMNRFAFGSTIDESKYRNDAIMINYADLDEQTAPLPYKTITNGNWDDSATWLNGDVQFIPGINASQEILETIDYNIVEIDHEIILDNGNTSYITEDKNNTRTLLGLKVNPNAKLVITGDNTTNTGNALKISHYLLLNGKIDLEGESQLIQTEGSDLDIRSSGALEIDQQGTKDLYSYKHWSSPVGVCNTSSNNNSYNLASNILKNGTLSAAPKNIVFLSSGYNGNISGTEIEIADFWIWKFTNAPSANYATWQHVRSNGSIKPGEGFTMKGVESSASSFVDKQNYVFEGKPFNGDIEIEIQKDNEYLVGNPYASAIDANAFIKDNLNLAETNGNNTNVINGTLYFWDHFGAGSHALDEYEGGYAAYTLIGGVPALNHDNRIATTGTKKTHTWGRYIPVGQGFFVSSILDDNLGGSTNVSGGILRFKNSQRIFHKESASTELSNKQTSTKSPDIRKSLRLKFNSPNGYHRQILLGTDSKCTSDFDLGYDAPLIENNKEDMYWLINTDKLMIQGINDITEHTILPLGIKIGVSGEAKISIDSLENVQDNFTVLVHDKLNNTSHDLKQSDFEVYLERGTYEDRFDIVFSSVAVLSNTPKANINDKIEITIRKENNTIVINNSNSKLIENLEIYNLLGQKINDIPVMSNNKTLTFRNNHISGDGVYIVKVNTDESVVTKKFIVRG